MEKLQVHSQGISLLGETSGEQVNKDLDLAAT